MVPTPAGLRCANYGVTRDAVPRLDVVHANGRLFRTGRRAIKGVAGCDLTSLFVGSEDTLGVIVGATLRLRPLPLGTATISTYFADAASAFAAIAAARAAGVVPAVAEFIDAATLHRIDQHLGSDLRGRVQGQHLPGGAQTALPGFRMSFGSNTALRSCWIRSTSSPSPVLSW